MFSSIRLLFLTVLTLTPMVGFSALRPKLHQTLEGFDNPISCAFSLDGNTLFMVNSARGEYGWVAGRGAISKVVVAADGTMELTEQRFVADLTGPMGIAVLPVDTDRFKAGTVFVSQGGAWAVDRGGKLIRNSFDLEAGVFAIDPETGRVVGKLLMGPKTPFSRSLGHGVVNPLAITFDPMGNLYLCDGGSGGRNLVPPIVGRAGVIRIPASSLDEAAAGNDVPGLAFLDVAHGPTSVFWDEANNALMATTGDGMGPLGGAVYRLPRGDFSNRGAIETVGQALSPIAGAFILPSGKVIVTVISGEIREIRSLKKWKDVRLKPDLFLVTPGSVASKLLEDGSTLVVMPEQAGGGIANWRQRAQILIFPAGS